MTDPAAPDLAIVELKPCPFCGGEASGDGHIRYSRPLADTTWADESEITECFFVNCVKCGISNGHSGLVCGYQNKADAIAAWNTRADSPEAAQCIEMLVEALENLLKFVGRRRADGHYEFALVPNRDVEAARDILAKVRGR